MAETDIKSFMGLLATLLIHERRIDPNAKIATYCLNSHSPVFQRPASVMIEKVRYIALGWVAKRTFSI